MKSRPWVYPVLFFFVLLAFIAVLDAPVSNVPLASLPANFWASLGGITLLAALCAYFYTREMSSHGIRRSWQSLITIMIGALLIIGICIDSGISGWTGGKLLIGLVGTYLLFVGLYLRYRKHTY